MARTKKSQTEQSQSEQSQTEQSKTEQSKTQSSTQSQVDLATNATNVTNFTEDGVTQMELEGDKSFVSQYNELMDILNKRHKEDTLLKKSVKRLCERALKQMNKPVKRKNKSKIPRMPTGFGKQMAVPVEFKKLFDIKENEIPRTSISRLLHDYLKNNNLKDAKDKRVHRVNDALSETFGFTTEQVKYMNESNDSKDKNGFNFYNVQNYIKAIYDKMPVVTETVVEVKTEQKKLVQVEEEKTVVSVDEKKTKKVKSKTSAV
jgi:hypothetical protein